MRTLLSLSFHAPTGVCPSTEGILGIESNDARACCVASCGQCGGDGCSAAGAASDCCVNNIVETGQACSVRGAAPCYIGDGTAKALVDVARSGVP